MANEPKNHFIHNRDGICKKRDFSIEATASAFGFQVVMQGKHM